MANNFLSTLGLTRRAGALIKGRTEVSEALMEARVKEFFISNDVSENSMKEIRKMKQIHNAKVYRVNFTKEDLGNAAGLKPLAVFAIENKGLLDSLKKSDCVEEADI